MSEKRLLFFGSYNPTYARNRVLLDGLRENGATVIECNERSGRFLKYVRLAFKFWKLRNEFEVMIVPFPGQEGMLLARFLTRKPIVFDAFTSHYEGYVHDRKTARPGSLRARWYHWVDRAACLRADAIITDTHAHAQYFCHEFGVPMKKMTPIFVGSDPRLMHLALAEPSGPFTVHFHGTGIPLQGIPTILAAAELLKDQGMVFNLIGVNRPRISYGGLAGAMAAAHVCLGIFGTTEKTQRVIPNKVFEALAVGRPVITADTPAIRELLDDDSAILIPTGNARALADAIMRLRDDAELRERMGRAGHAVFQRRATPAILGRQVLQICHNLYERKR